MDKNTATLPPDFLAQLSKVFVTERLGIRPEQHQLTSEKTWIRLAERLIKLPAPTHRQSTKAKHRGGKR